MESNHLISREIFAEVPVRVVYEMTPKAMNLIGLVDLIGHLDI
jgi:DNA-binding HxlR family transcriptional regulator